jgi:transposase-like protein
MNVPTENECLAFLESIRWSNQPICPYCDSERTSTMPRECRHRCNNCNTAFNVTVGTVFHRTHLPLRKWFAAISLILDTREPISARNLAWRLGINKNTAWQLNRRIGLALLEPSQRDILLEIADLNETYLDDEATIPRAEGAA